MRRVLEDFSLTAAVAGVLAVVVTYAGSSVLIFQAASLAGFSSELTSSWIWALSIGSGLTGLFLSWRMRVPVITAWSTPGAALLMSALSDISVGEAVGAYITSAAIIIFVGLSGSLDTIIRRIPTAVSSGMFAGILFGFGTKVFTSLAVDPVLCLGMFAIFLIFRYIQPRWAIAAVMLGGMALAWARGQMHFEALHIALAIPVWMTPEWSLPVMLSVGVPLALVTLTGQYISGMAVLHASGYMVPANGIMAVTGLASLVLAPFGSHAVNLSSITAAICTGPESHPDLKKRYITGIVGGLTYIIIGTFGTTLTSLFAALPSVLIAVLAGLALISAFASGLTGIVKDEANQDAGVIAFLATASGVHFLGLGAPFWGLLLGWITYLAKPKLKP